MLNLPKLRHQSMVIGIQGCTYVSYMCINELDNHAINIIHRNEDDWHNECDVLKCYLHKGIFVRKIHSPSPRGFLLEISHYQKGKL